MSELIKKVRLACAFGSPDKFVTGEIVTELERLFAERDKLRATAERVREQLRYEGGSVNVLRRRIKEALDG